MTKNEKKLIEAALELASREKELRMVLQKHEGTIPTHEALKEINPAIDRRVSASHRLREIAADVERERQ